MPKVNNLSSAKPATPAKPKATAKAVVATPVKSTPAAPLDRINPADSKALATAAKSVNIPAWLQKSEMPTVADRDFGGYIGFASTQSNKWNEQQAAKLADGDPYLYHDKTYIPANPLEFFLLAGTAFQTLMVGREGKFQWASRDMEEEGPRMGSNRPEPHYVCVCIVRVQDRLIPIKGDFRGTKSGGCEGAIRAVEAAATPEWLKLTDAHRVTSAFPQAFGRVFHSCTTKYQVSKTSGNPYYRANVTSLPATFTQMQELLNAMGDEAFIAELDECKKNYDARVRFIDDVIANPPSANAPPAAR